MEFAAGGHAVQHGVGSFHAYLYFFFAASKWPQADERCTLVRLIKCVLILLLPRCSQHSANPV
jgi:hypothetical protein